MQSTIEEMDGNQIPADASPFKTGNGIQKVSWIVQWRFALQTTVYLPFSSGDVHEPSKATLASTLLNQRVVALSSLVQMDI